MGQKVKILVYWDDETDAPTAANVSIAYKKGEAKIEWVLDDTVASITSIEGLNPPEFLDVKQAGKRWKGTDCCSKKGKWEYQISGTKQNASQVRTADPAIRNDEDE